MHKSGLVILLYRSPSRRGTGRCRTGPCTATVPPARCRRGRLFALRQHVEVRIERRGLVDLGHGSRISWASAARWGAGMQCQVSWIRCKCSMSRSRLRGRSPSRARTSSSATGSICRPFGWRRDTPRPEPGWRRRRGGSMFVDIRIPMMLSTQEDREPFHILIQRFSEWAAVLSLAIFYLASR